MPERLEVEVFRAGDYGAKGAWDEAALDTIAGDYDPSSTRRRDGRSRASVRAGLVEASGARRTARARLRITSAKLIELRRGGAFKKTLGRDLPRVARDGAAVPARGELPRAAAPEVKGLADPEIAESAPAPLFAENDPPHEAIEAEIGGAENEAGDEAAAAKRFAALFDRLCNEGRWDPAWNGLGMDAFFVGLAAPAREWFERFVLSLRPLVTMAETAPRVIRASEASIPSGGNVDTDSIALHRAAVAFQQEHPGLCYAEALARCAGRG